MYPKKITIKNEKLKKLLEERKNMVNSGIEMSKEIERLETEMKEIDEEIKVIEKGVDVSDIDNEAKELTDKFLELQKEMDVVSQKIYDRLSEFVPKELKDKYHEMHSQKEKLEEDRNKLALKIQKYKDKIIPIARKEIKPFITEEFEDFEGVEVVDGEVQGTIFNHLYDFKKRFFEKNLKW